MTAVSGTNQTGTTGSFLPLPLVAQETDSSGNPLQNAPITFYVASGSAILVSSTSAPLVSGSLTETTGTDGTASAYLYVASAGPIQIKAIANGYGTGATFSEDTGEDNNDDDGDGYPNTYEYLAGTDPENANSTPTPDIVVSGSGGDFTSIQDAIDSVTRDYEIIQVQPGIYSENLVLSNHKVLLISASGAASTIIDGSALDSVIMVSNNSVISGFTIRDGEADQQDDTRGGGIRVQGGSPRITNCVITGNVSLAGGAVANDEGTPTFLHCTIFNNMSDGGAVDSGNTVATFVNSILWNPETASEVSGTAAAFNYCDIRGGLTGTTNISADPLLSPDGHLMVTGTVNTSGTNVVYSPCIRMGGSVPNIPIMDMDNEPRPHWTLGTPSLLNRAGHWSRRIHRQQR